MKELSRQIEILNGEGGIYYETNKGTAGHAGW